MGASALRVRSTRPAQLPTTAQRRRRPVAIAVVRFAPFCYVVSATAPLARSLHSVRRRGSRSRPPLPPSLPPSCNRRHRRDGVIFRRARTHSLTFSARSLGRSIGRSHFGSIAAPPCLRITRVRVSQLPRRKTSSVYIAGSRICDLRCADETRTAWTQSVSSHRWISWICVCISLPLRAQTEDMRLQKGKNDLIHFPRYFPQYGSLSTPNLNILVYYYDFWTF